MMQFSVKKGFEYAGEEWRAGEILTVIRQGEKLVISTMDGKHVEASDTSFQSIRGLLRNVTPPRE